MTDEPDEPDFEEMLAVASVEAALGAVNWQRPKTDGFLRSALEALGISTRGRKLSSAELAALARANHLPVVDTEDAAITTEGDR